MMRKEMKVETESISIKPKEANPRPPPPPPLPLPRFWAKKRSQESVTNREIAKFWKQKKIVEEDHLLAAIKAAARIRARNLSEEDYKRFEESLTDEDGNDQKTVAPTNISKGDEKKKDIRVGIKDC
ncbi:hypothetical protein COLO4_22495 [Corchorus olitorius]|uniref:Uncharacterized protein n=1 Tax=Corchorus olitorius TaxID=93759 RepID=A0A1R3ILI7_9ROSI|nr:hypothetical protein COLO4_22495 [Corchorus olitorius]